MRQMLIRISLILALLFVAGGNAWALDTIYIVRHAEKAEGWPTTREVSALRPLSEIGFLARATGDRFGELEHRSSLCQPHNTNTAHWIASGPADGRATDCRRQNGRG